MVCTSRIVLCAALALLLSVVAGAAALSSRDPYTSDPTPDASFPLKPAVVWRAHLGAWNIGATPSNTLLVDGTVMVAIGKMLYALSDDTGELFWQQPLHDQPLGDLLLVDGAVIVSHLNGMVRGYKVADGTLAWSAHLSGHLRNGPTVADDAIMFATKNGTIAGVERTGERAVREIDVKGEIVAAPVPVGSTLILAYEDGKILQLEKTLSRQLARFSDTKIAYTPATDGKNVLLTTNDKLIMLDVTNRLKPVRWEYPVTLRTNTPPAIEGDTVYFATATGSLHALDVATGADKWVRTTVRDEDGKEVIDRKVGIQLPYGAISNPRVYRDTVVVRMGFGLLGVYDATTGALRWQYQLPKPPTPATPPATEETANMGEMLFTPAQQPTTGYHTGDRNSTRGNRSRRDNQFSPPMLPTVTDATAGDARNELPTAKLEKFTIGAPAVSGDDLFFAGSDGSVYRLSATAPDIDPPIITPVIAEMTVKSGHGIVAAPEVTTIALNVTDEGSGIDPTSITILVNNIDRTADTVNELENGRYALTLPADAPLGPGLHQLKVSASDHRGNAHTLIFDFVVNASAETPLVPIVISSEFLPRNLQVTPGTLVVWKNTSGHTRKVVSDTGHFASDTLYPQGIPNGGTWMWLVPDDARPGTGYYYHDPMNGKPGRGTSFGTGLTGRLEIIAPEYPTTPDVPGTRPTGSNPGGRPGTQIPPNNQLPPGVQLPPGFQLPPGMQMPPSVNPGNPRQPGMTPPTRAPQR